MQRTRYSEHTHIHTHTHTHAHTRTHTHTHTHACVHTHTHTHIRTHTHTPAHACAHKHTLDVHVQSYTQPHSNARTLLLSTARTHTLTNTHTKHTHYTSTYTYKHIHIHIHIHTQTQTHIHTAGGRAACDRHRYHLTRQGQAHVQSQAKHGGRGGGGQCLPRALHSRQMGDKGVPVAHWWVPFPLSLPSVFGECMPCSLLPAYVLCPVTCHLLWCAHHVAACARPASFYIMCRVGQNHIYTHIYTLYTRCSCVYVGLARTIHL